MKKLAYLIVFLLASGFGPTTFSMLSSDNRITVSYKEKIKDVNPDIFGTNVVVNLPVIPENKSLFYDYGSGFWDPVKKEVPAGIFKIIKDTKTPSIRFHCGEEEYLWSDTIADDRTNFLLGVNEQITAAESLGAEPVILINYYTTSPESAAELVAFTNGRVKYFEIGNEIYWTSPSIEPETYVTKYLEYHAKMKAVDPTIQLGVPLKNNDSASWNETLLTIKDKIDFGILHTYIIPYVTPGSEHIFPGYFLYQLSQFEGFDTHFKELSAALTKPIAVTEYNSYWVWDHRLYRHSLGNALINAELIKLLLNNDVLFANHYSLSTDGFGMVFNDFRDATDLANPYRLRPNYYLFKMYADYFKEILINTEVVAEQYDEDIEYLSVVASKSNDNSSICVMVINRKDAPINVDLYIKNFYYNCNVTTYSLEGPSLEATNEDGETVNVKESSAILNNQICNVTLQKYSVTAIVIDKNKTTEK